MRFAEPDRTCGRVHSLGMCAAPGRVRRFVTEGSVMEVDAVI